MTKILSEAVIAQFKEKGYHFPLRILDDAQVADHRGRLEVFEAEQGGPITGATRNKSHLLFKWVDDLMRNAALLDPVEDLLGPDILCWNTLFWVKEPHSGAFVSWHQDLNNPSSPWPSEDGGAESNFLSVE